MGPFVESILLVEDDFADAQLIKRALTKAGVAIPVHRVKNGDEAIAYLQGESPFQNRNAHPFPGVIILDLKLPRRSGFEVLEWIRAQHNDMRLVPVVVLSSSTVEKDVNRAYALGANSFLSKPYEVAEFVKMATAFRHYWLSVNEDPFISPRISATGKS
jgi:CheY-like chemotaxis protein